MCVIILCFAMKQKMTTTQRIVANTWTFARFQSRPKEDRTQTREALEGAESARKATNTDMKREVRELPG